MFKKTPPSVHPTKALAPPTSESLRQFLQRWRKWRMPGSVRLPGGIVQAPMQEDDLDVECDSLME